MILMIRGAYEEVCLQCIPVSFSDSRLAKGEFGGLRCNSTRQRALCHYHLFCTKINLHPVKILGVSACEQRDLDVAGADYSFKPSAGPSSIRSFLDTFFGYCP